MTEGTIRSMMKEMAGRIKKDIKAYYPAALAILAYLTAMELLFGGVCPAVLLTGLPCPGCGITRALALFLQGRLYEAFLMHPFFYPLFFLALLFGICRYALGKNTIFLKKYAVACLIGMLLFYAYRMAFWFPDREPMLYRDTSLLGRLLRYLRPGFLFLCKK